MSTEKTSPEDLAAELTARVILSATLSAPRRPDGGASKVRIRLLQGQPPRWQAEEFRGNQSFHANLDKAGLEALLASQLGSRWARAEFVCQDGSVSVLANRRGELKALGKTAPGSAGAKASRGQGAQNAGPAGLNYAEVTPCAEGSPCALPASHNREKRRILNEGTPVPFLVDLGVMTAEGKVVKAKYDKYRQINRYLEFVEDILPELEGRLKAGAKELTVVDFGCGKSYLTFAVYHYLVNLRGIPARIVGLDLKEEVIASCSSLARSYGYDGLSFETGDIAGYRGLSRADMVMTLHACDTATDAALDQAVRWGAAAILSVPCCQHELNAQLSRKAAGRTAEEGELPGRTLLEPAFRHGIVRERMAALLTDAFRAELLEAAGYRVQLLEFIDITHTPKNLLIRAVLRRDRSGMGPESGGNAPNPTLRLSESYTSLRDALGAEPALERFLLRREAP